MRIHGTTRQLPMDLIALERTLLKTLPAQAPDLGVWQCVTLHRDCHVKFDYKLYSAPFAPVGKELWLRATDNCVAFFDSTNWWQPMRGDSVPVNASPPKTTCHPRRNSSLPVTANDSMPSRFKSDRIVSRLLTGAE